MRSPHHIAAAGERLAYCSICRGVLPFQEVRYRQVRSLGPVRWSGPIRTGVKCERCRVVHGMVNPAGETRWRSRRYFLYAGVTLTVALLAAWSPVTGAPGGVLPGILIGALSLACLVKGLQLGSIAGAFEPLEPFEVAELTRRLCPGMLREDVAAELARRGWRPGKIRALLSSVRPLSQTP